MKSRSILHLLLALAVRSQAQHIAPAAVVPAGGAGTAGAVQLQWTLGQAASSTFTGAAVLTTGVQQPDDAGPRVHLRVLLEGPWRADAGLMVDSLRTQGLLPVQEPYTALGFAVSGPLGCDPAVYQVSGPDAITDWVLVELRRAAAPEEVLEARAALLQRDGDVVAVDGVSPLRFNRAPEAFHVAVRHRNHLGAMSADTIPPDTTTVTLDLSLPTAATFGTEAQKSANGRQLLWAGNVVRDAQLRYTGGANDRDAILAAIGGVVPTNVTTGYRVEDVNLDGAVKYTGDRNDRDPVLSNVGGVVPTNIRNEQLP